MELHQLRYMIAVAKTGNFSRAAEMCHVSQPSLSQQIQKLEQELGEPLFVRRRQRNSLTPLGERFLSRAERILREIGEAKADAEAYTGGLSGALRVGVIPTVAPYLMPSLLKASLKKYPGLSFQISEETTDRLLQAMHLGQVDVSILSLPVEGNEWEIEQLFQDELLVALPWKHGLSGSKGAIRIAELVQEKLVLMKEAHCLSGQTLQVCSRAGYQPEVYLHSSQIETLLAMVECGMGISFVPDMARPYSVKRKIHFASLEPKVFRPIALVWQKNNSRTRAFRAFRELCLEQLSDKAQARR